MRSPIKDSSCTQTLNTGRATGKRRSDECLVLEINSSGSQLWESAVASPIDRAHGYPRHGQLKSAAVAAQMGRFPTVLPLFVSGGGHPSTPPIPPSPLSTTGFKLKSIWISMNKTLAQPAPLQPLHTPLSTSLVLFFRKEPFSRGILPSFKEIEEELYHGHPGPHPIAPNQNKERGHHSL